MIRQQRPVTAVDRSPMTLVTHMDDREEGDELILLLATLIGGDKG